MNVVIRLVIGEVGEQPLRAAEVRRGKSEHLRARAPANSRAGRPDGRKCNRKHTAAVLQ